MTKVTHVRLVSLQTLPALSKSLGRGVILTNPSKRGVGLTVVKGDWLISCHYRRTATLEDRMHHLETLIQAIPPAVFAAGGVLPSNTGGQTSMDTVSQSLPFMYSPTQFPSGVPPPSLHVFPLTNPSTHFTENPAKTERCSSGEGLLDRGSTPDHLAEASRVSLAGSYLYFDDEGYTRWQGETSGLPVLDLLLERYAPANNPDKSDASRSETRTHASRLVNATSSDWFPNRTPRRTDVNPQALWRLMTSYIVPDLMDRYRLPLFFCISIISDHVF